MADLCSKSEVSFRVKRRQAALAKKRGSRTPGSETRAVLAHQRSTYTRQRLYHTKEQDIEKIFQLEDKGHTQMQELKKEKLLLLLERKRLLNNGRKKSY